MPTSGGPNTLGENNLVFTYDTSDVKNSYIGEPTVNITSGTITPHTPYNTLVRNGQNFTLTMVPGSPKYLTLHNGTNYVGQTLSYSGYMYKNGIPFNPLSTSAVPTTYQSSSGMSNQFYNPETGYFKFTLYFNASSLWLFHQPVGAVDNDIIQINNLQIEVKNHTTPFTTNTRSSTQGLLPLIGNSTIDLSNISFDSNAQMVFDGTNDYINLGQLNITNTPFTYETVIKPYSITGGHSWILGKSGNNMGLTRYDNYIAFYLYDSSNNLFSAEGGVLNTTSYFHIIGVYTGVVLQLYINNILIGTSGNITLPRNYNGNNTYVGTPNGSDLFFQGEIPVVKIYNRSLTPQEVRQNYQQHKTRFKLS